MTLLNKQIQLKGISQKGKNRIRENGDRWVVLADPAVGLQVGGLDRNKGWMFIAPVGMTKDSNASRWIQSENDPDFTWTEVG